MIRRDWVGQWAFVDLHGVGQDKRGIVFSGKWMASLAGAFFLSPTESTEIEFFKPVLVPPA
jgi:hypothetical protein